ncbi:MAG: sensor histidine kinase [Spirochaetales bacterium]
MNQTVPEREQLIRLQYAGPAWLAGGWVLCVVLFVLCFFQVDADNFAAFAAFGLTGVTLAWLLTGVALQRRVIAPLREVGAAVRANNTNALNNAARSTSFAELHALIASSTSYIVYEHQRSEELATAMRLRTAELASTIEQLERTQDSLRRQERLVSLGQLAAGVAHEVNNPAGYIRNNLEILQQYVDDLIRRESEFRECANRSERVGELLEQMDRFDRQHDMSFVFSDLPHVIAASRTGVERIIRIVSSLTTFARTEDGTMHPVRVADSVRTALDMMRTSLPDDIELDIRLDEDAWSCASAGRLEQVFINLLSNARDALTGDTQHSSESSKRIAIQMWHGGNEQNTIAVAIRDNGCGMDSRVLERALDPFFTTKGVGEGTGLGLSIAHEIVDGIGGSMDIQSQPGRGTVVLMRMPDCGGTNGNDRNGN